MKSSRQGKTPARDDETKPNVVLVILAFGAIYFLWGGTFLAIRFAVDSFPPFLLMSIRCLVGGGILYAYEMFRGVSAPTAPQWGQAFIAGALFFLVSHGGLAWAEQYVPSGVAALLFTTMPFWLILTDWIAGNTGREPGRVGLGLILGFLGVLLLIGSDWISGIHRLRLIPVAIILISAVSWALGSIYSRVISSAAAVTRKAALHLLAGGVLLLVASIFKGEWSVLANAEITLRSTVSLVYLIFMGTLTSFTAYTWLLKVSTPAQVGTYSFVNPVVAVFLGWVLGEEQITWEILLAAAVIIAGVILIVSSRAPPGGSGFPIVKRPECFRPKTTAEMPRGS